MVRETEDVKVRRLSETPIVPGGQFGDAATSDLVIRVGASENCCEFRVHWVMLSAIFQYFAKMKESAMTEAKSNSVTFVDDDPIAWHLLLTRCYYPDQAYTVAHAIHILPL